VNSEITSS